MTVVSPAAFLARLMDGRVPFRLYFCVREPGHVAFDVGHDAPKPWHVLYLPEAGSILARVEGVEAAAGPGQLLWIQPGARFRIVGPVKAARLTISVCRFHLRDARPYRLAEPYRLGAISPREPVLDELLPGHRIEPAAEQFRARAVLARILCRAFFPPEGPGVRAREAGLSPPVRERAALFIRERIAERFPVDAVAREVGLNPDYFARQFRRSFGVPPRAWITRIRIRQAADHLLAGTSSVSEVARRFGYESVFFFSRQFRQVMGASPRAWRAGAAAK